MCIIQFTATGLLCAGKQGERCFSLRVQLSVLLYLKKRFSFSSAAMYFETPCRLYKKKIQGTFLLQIYSKLCMLLFVLALQGEREQQFHSLGLTPTFEVPSTKQWPCRHTGSTRWILYLGNSYVWLADYVTCIRNGKRFPQWILKHNVKVSF